jgi:hypothetical protein
VESSSVSAFSIAYLDRQIYCSFTVKEKKIFTGRYSRVG